MRRLDKWKRWFVLSAWLLTAGANAQTIRVTVKPAGGGAEQLVTSVTSPAAVPINLSSIEANFPNYQFIRVDTQAGVANIGVIQISAPNGTSQADVRILLADASQSAFPVQFDDPFFLSAWGAQNLAGIDTSALSAADRDKVRLAATIAGDLTGAVSVGTVYSFAAAGTIAGNITASRNDGLSASLPQQQFEPTDQQLANQPGNYDYAIQSIRSNTGISGNIGASNGSIRSLFVGPGENVAGLQGNIAALNGHIRNIDTKGPIGAANHIVDIVAGYGIRQIFVGFESGTLGGLPATDATRPRNVYANIEASLSVGSPPPSDLSLGWTRSIRISGNYAGGSVNTRMMRSEGTANYLDTDGTKWGLFVDGSVTVPIHVRSRVVQASLVAARFLGPITVDVELKGRIEATATDGHIESVRVAMDPNLVPLFDSDTGMVGSVRRPRWDNPPNAPPRVDEPEGVVRAVTIGEVKARQMRLTQKTYPPRIEAQSIGSLQIGRLPEETAADPYQGMTEGLIWSGVGAAGPNTALDSTYALIDHISISNMYKGVEFANDIYQTAMWVWGGFSSFEIVEYTQGRIYLPQLNSGKIIKIGCELSGAGGDPNFAFVRVRDALGMSGQVTIGASSRRDGTNECVPTGSSTAWLGTVQVGTGASAIRLLDSVSSPPADRAPYYERTGSTLGTDADGGAVGQVPYHLQRTERKLKPYAGDATPTQLLQSEFSPVNGFTTAARQELEMWWYGPVRVPSVGDGDGQFPFRLFFSPTENGTPTELPTFTPRMYARVRAGNNGPESRIISFGVVSVNNASQMFPPGYYTVRPGIENGQATVLCDGLLSNIGIADAPGIAVDGDTFADGDFTFRVLPDCDLDLCPDGNGPGECAFGSQCDQGGGICIADVDDGSGMGTPDGGVTIDDLLYYLAIYTAGGSNADVDDGSGTGTHDGGVTIDDLLFFLNRYALGC